LETLDLTLPALKRAYTAGGLTPADALAQVLQEIERTRADNIWIHVLPEDTLLRHAQDLAGKDPRTLPLYGIPFAIKDNIDLAGVPTTAACPAYTYALERSAFVVERLLAAEAIPIGKTNLDQFAAGLTGTRTPYGATRNAFDPRFVSGGSSSGSAVAVANGLVSFAPGHRHRGLGPCPRRLQQSGGNQAHARPAQHVRRDAGLPQPRLRERLGAHRRRRGSRDRDCYSVRPRRFLRPACPERTARVRALPIRGAAA
jgi:hypothetical protein